MSQGFAVSQDGAGRLDFDLQIAWSPVMRDAFMASGADGLVANYAEGSSGVIWSSFVTCRFDV